MLRAVFAGLVATALWAPPEAMSAIDAPSLRAVRFYRLDHRHTRVAAFLEIPLTMVRPHGPGNAGPLCYRVIFRLVDANGTTVDMQTWRTRLDGGARPLRKHLVETMEFLIPAGRFRLIAAVRDSASGNEGSATLDLEGFASAPLASDLLLSPDIRTASVDDSVPRPGEIRRGPALVTAAAVLYLSGTASTAHYLLEAYGPGGQSAQGTMVILVRDSTGTVVRRKQPLAVQVHPGGSVLRGKVNVAGLAPGRYELTVIVALGGATVERSAEFVVEGSEAGASSRN
jgi:hypothetical protein